jgi:hypothetical protein
VRTVVHHGRRHLDDQGLRPRLVAELRLRSDQPHDRRRAASARLRDPDGRRAFSPASSRARPRSRSATCARRATGIRAAIESKTRICVHGDYDVDGICATTLAVLILRELGAEVDWHLPEPLRGGLRRRGRDARPLAAEGCGLVLTVDCGITAVEEDPRAKAAGLDVIVTDHHAPATSCPTARSSRPRPSAVPRSRSSAAPASSTSSARRSSAPRRSRSIST